MGIFLQMTNRCYGKSISGVRCREPGAYGQHDDKYTLILAIGTNGFKHASLENIPGMSCVYVEKCICVTYISALRTLMQLSVMMHDIDRYSVVSSQVFVFHICMRTCRYFRRNIHNIHSRLITSLASVSTEGFPVGQSQSPLCSWGFRDRLCGWALNSTAATVLSARRSHWIRFQ